MNTKKTINPIQAVPTNIITGFLGVGKTSTILHLLNNKPTNERWAVLVNEFGEIGVDGSLMEGQQGQENGVFIREVPGGCMCCAAGVPMQVALNQLLTKAKPDRLLIEPTGLGHPKEILQILSSKYYQGVLSLQKTLTLIDARKLSDQRYTTHNTFNQQIAIADTIIANKSDLYSHKDKEKLVDYIKLNNPYHAKIIFSQYGDINYDELDGETSTQLENIHTHHHSVNNKKMLSDIPIPECGFVKAVNEGEGYKSIGWRFSPKTQFSYTKLKEFFWTLRVDRMKAVFNTDKGMIGFNLDNEILTEIRLENCQESRIEIITTHINENIKEAKLMECIEA